MPGGSALSSRRHLGATGVVGALAASALAGCGGGGGIHISAPTPPTAVAADCAAFIKALPNNLVPGQSRRSATPASPYTAAFGSPAVTVRCGIAVPKHDPTSFVDEVDNVDWLLLSGAGGAQRYVSYTSRLVVDIVIPHNYLPADVLLGIPHQLLGAPPASSDD